MYGVEFLREYDQHDADHQSRRDRLCELPSGPKLLPDAFDCILSRVSYSSSYLITSFTHHFQSVKVKESTVFSRKYCTELTSLVCYVSSIHCIYLTWSVEHPFGLRGRDLVLQRWKHHPAMDPQTSWSVLILGTLLYQTYVHVNRGVLDVMCC